MRVITMKMMVVLLFLILLCLPAGSAAPAAENLLAKLTWTGQAGIRIKSGIVVHIDPYRVAKPEKADLILITHSHQDHYSPGDIDKIKKADTVLVVPKDLEKCGLTADVTAIEPGQVIEAKGIRIGAMAAYNTSKPHHPQANKWVGYVLEINGATLYHAGDTDFLPEMKELKGVDIALLPVGGIYTMDPAEAAEAAKAIQAGITIPLHNLAPANLEQFKSLYPDARILKVQG